MTQSWLYDAILYIYALSLLFFFSDYIGKNRGGKRIGEGLLGFVWLLQTGYMAAGFYENRATLTFSMFETFLFFSWLLITVTLALNRFVRIDMLVFWVNVFGFGVLALNFFSHPEIVPFRPEWEISDELLFIHITLSVGSYAVFSIAAVLSGMYLFLHRRLKERTWTSAMKRMPSLERLDDYACRAVIAGVPMFLMAITLGVVWLLLLDKPLYLLDWKVLHSVVVLTAYAYDLMQRLSRRMSGYRLAIWNLASFAVMLVNFIWSNSFSQFHY